MQALRTLALVALAAGCEPGTSSLAVDARAELVPGVEFDAVRTEVLTGDATGRFAEHAVTATEDYPRGVRVAELDGLARGPVTVRVTLMRAGAEVMQRPVQPVRVLADRVIVGVGVGESHTCALDDTGRVWCWGDNSVSQLGEPGDFGRPEPRTVCPPTE